VANRIINKKSRQTMRRTNTPEFLALRKQHVCGTCRDLVLPRSGCGCDEPESN
jgi:hypothetical protein